jgi:cytochrome c oxidase assembly protein subunit 15
VSRLRLSPQAFRRLCQLTLVIVVLNVVTGAAVRLSDSGLGCPDWPTCSKHQLTPPLSLHPVLEFGNRLVVFVLVVACAAALIGAWRRSPFRKDLTWLAGGLILGVIGEAVMGGILVYSKLNPYVDMGHFTVGMALVAVAVVLTLRSGHAAGRGRPLVGSAPMRLTQIFMGLVVVALVAGTATTGTGPHAGGPGAKRIPLGLSDMTRIHAEIALGAAAFLLVVLLVLWRSNAPGAIQDRGRILLLVMVAQGIVGYSQYFTHLPAVLVGIHVFGATTVWAATLWFHHGLSDHDAETPPRPAVEDVVPATPVEVAT